MKKLLAVLVLMLSLSVSAQTVELILTSGLSVRGVLIEKTNEIVKIKSADGTVSGFKSGEVEKIQTVRSSTTNNNFYGVLSVGALGGSEFSGNATFVNGFQLSKHWGVGLGLGIESFYGRTYMPTFLEGKFNLFATGSTPFLTAGFGYDIPFQVSNGNKGGFFGQGLLGFQHQLGNHISIITGIGFRYGQLQVENWGWWSIVPGPTKTIYEINRFDLRFGFIFR